MLAINILIGFIYILLKLTIINIIKLTVIDIIFFNDDSKIFHIFICNKREGGYFKG